MQADFRAIIFDLDGTLVDSEPVHAEAWLAILAQYNLHFDHHWFSQWVGLSDRHLAENTISEYELLVSVEDMRAQKQALYHELLQTSLYPFDGVEEGLAYLLERGIPMALATNSSRVDVDQVFKATGLGRYLKELLTADEVSQLKPAPEIYQLAAHRLGMAPAQCIAVEDSPAGIAAAKRAGMYVLGLMTSQGVQHLGEADEILEHTRQAMDRIKILLASA